MLIIRQKQLIRYSNSNVYFFACMITCLSVCGGADVFCPALVMYMLIAQGISNALTAAKHTSAISGMKPPKRGYRSNRKSCSSMKSLL